MEKVATWVFGEIVSQVIFIPVPLLPYTSSTAFPLRRYCAMSQLVGIDIVTIPFPAESDSIAADFFDLETVVNNEWYSS